MSRSDLARHDGEVGDREVVCRIDEIEAMMRHRGAVGERRLGGADVHPPVDLHRIDDDQFDLVVAVGQGHGDVALPGGGRPQDHQGIGGHPARTAMRRLCNGSDNNSTNRPTRWCGAARVISMVAYAPARTGCGGVK